VLDDLRFAIRKLRRSPGFTGVAVVTLALAIGANAAIFSFADAVLFRPLPYDDSDRIFVLQMANRQTGQRYLLTPYEYLQAIEAHHSAVGAVGLLEQRSSLIVQTPDGAERMPTVEVSPNYFSILGTRPARGRIFSNEDAQQGRPAMLSYASWRQRFGGDEQLVGRAVEIGGETFDIVGVLPDGWVFPTRFARRAELITLMPPLSAQQSGGTFHPIVRLEKGTLQQAQAETDALIAPLAQRNRRTANSTVTLDDVRSVLYPAARTIMLFLVASSGLVLLIGCMNLANMLLVRAARQEREIGVRAALGGSRLRLVRPTFFESLILGAAGAVLALLATEWSFDSLLRLVPPMAYGQAPVGVDGRVAMIALAMGVLASAVFAVVPAWRVARADPQVLWQSRHRRRRTGRGWLRNPLITIQVAGAIVLVFGAVVAGRAFVSILNVPLGFDPDGVVTVSVWPPAKGSALQAVYARAVETLGRRPDVLSAGAIGSMPFDSSAPDEGIPSIDGARLPAGIVHMLPGYFETAGIRLLRGRLLNWDDVRGGSDGAVLSESAAAAMFPGQDALGSTFTNGRGRRFTVVGIVSDVRMSLDRNAREFLPAYVIPHDDVRSLTIVARVRQGVGGEAVLADMKRQIGPMAPRTPITARWWSETISDVTAYRNPRFQSTVLGAFALLALGLTVLGIFGVVAFLVTSRTREMGIRLAIGATPPALVHLVLHQAMVPILAGLIAGLLATQWMAGFAEAQLFSVDSKDPLTLAAAAVVVALAALAGAYVPARHAARVDPVVALRAE
jgi:predicted permease